MSVEVKIPAVGESITSGVVSVWHKKSGDFVNAGDALFTLETDKVSTEIAAETAGVLDAIASEGQEVKIGEVVATIDDSKKPTEEKEAAKSKGKESEQKQKEPEKKKAPEEKKKEPEAEKKSVGKKEAKGEKPLSPAVRRILEEEEVEPAE